MYDAYIEVQRLLAIYGITILHIINVITTHLVFCIQVSGPVDKTVIRCSMLFTCAGLVVSLALVLKSTAEAGADCDLSSPVVIYFSSPTGQSEDACTNAGNSSGCCICQPQGIVKCELLDDALDRLKSISTKTKLNGFDLVLGAENATKYRLSRQYNFEGSSLWNVSIDSLGPAETIVNYECQAGLTISNAFSVSVRNIRWQGCGQNYSCASLSQSVAFSIKDTPIASFVNVTFTKSTGTAISLDVSEQAYSNPDCSGSSCPWLTKELSFVFVNSTFVHNGHQSDSDISNTGGAIEIQIRASIPAVISFERCNFEHNQAYYGGAIYVLAFVVEVCSESMINVSNTNFSYNSALSHGGSVYIDGIQGSFQNCLFYNNTAGMHGGGVYQSAVDSCYESTITFNNCVWTKNSAQGGGALLLIAESPIDTYEPGSNISAHILNSTFVNNLVTVYSFYGESACIILASDIPLEMAGTTIANNSASGLCLFQTELLVNDVVSIESNDGYHGGAMYIQDSQIQMQPGSTLLLRNNKAVSGGALYQDGKLNALKCLLAFENGSTVHQSSVVIISGNYVYDRGISVFFIDPQRSCPNVFVPPNVIIDGSSDLELASDATAMIFHNADNQFENGTSLLELALGQSLVLNLTVLDYFNNSATAFTNIILRDSNSGSDHYYALEGFQSASLQTGINELQLKITGPEVINQSMSDYRLTFLAPEFTQTIGLAIIPCPTGFEYDSDSLQCVCVPFDSVDCDFNNAMACVKQGYWVGQFDGVSASAPCSSELCENARGNCSECDIRNTNGYCQLPIEENDQCNGRRTGLVCTECESGSAFTFAGLDCAPESTCSGASIILPPLLSVIFLFFLLLCLLLLIRVGRRYKLAYLFAFVYYFSIVRLLLPGNIVGSAMVFIVSLFESVTQLNPRFLGYVPMCFSSSMSAIELQVFLYINPIIISLVLLAIVTLSRRCSKLTIFQGNVPLRSICLLILLSFTALSETSFNVLNPIILDGINGTRVNIQPITPYWDLNEHLPWYIISLFVLLVIVIPFTVFLLIAPFIVRCFNLTRIKPFLDEFQGSYRDRFRWMAGFYFLCRLFYMMILTSPSANLIATQYLTQMVSLGILLFHVLLQPYSSKWLNMTDTIFLADLLLLTLLYGTTAGIVFEFSYAFREVITFTLVFVPVAYMFIIISIACWYEFPVPRDRIKWWCMRKINLNWIPSLQSELSDPLLQSVPAGGQVDDEMERSRNRSTCIEYRDSIFTQMDHKGGSPSSITSFVKISADPINSKRSSHKSGQSVSVTVIALSDGEVDDNEEETDKPVASKESLAINPNESTKL